MTPETRACRSCQNSFTVEPDDFTFYEKMAVPVPALCPGCRFLRRAQFRNETTFYSRSCMKCGESIISMYHPKAPYTVYCEKCYHSDSWSPMDYGMEYNPKRPFLEQFRELLAKVPKMAMFIDQHRANINSPYVNYAGGHKNCYLIFNSGDCEESMYSRGIRFCKEVVDAYFAEKSERCYEVVNVNQSSGVQFGQNGSGCINSRFVLNASGLQNCVGCVNLRHQSYQWFNEPLEPEEWKKRLGEFSGSYRATEEFKARFREFSLKFPRRENSNLKAVNCTGDYLYESKNCKDCFETTNGENLRYAYAVKSAKDSYDILGFGYNSELLLECVGVGLGSQNVKSTYWAEASHHVEYSFALIACENCFGCNGLKHAQYAILNKQYPKEEYERIRASIVAELTAAGEYGLFFPPELAPFAYNETVAQDNFPSAKEEVLKRGFKWQDDLQMTTGKETVKPEEIPDHIKDVPDSITKEVLACTACGRNYRITPQELAFSRREVIPLPRKCFLCRHRNRIKQRGPVHIFDRTCAKCAKAIKTTYAPERPEIVYCEQCYQAEVA